MFRVFTVNGTVLAIAILVNIASLGIAQAQNRFSCSYGDRGACLGFGETVCSSFGKCVSDDAVCFPSYTCDFRGFVCKSDFNDVVDDHNECVEAHNDLLDRFRRLRQEYDDLLESAQRALEDFEASEARLDDLRRCVGFSDSLDEAQECAR